MADAKMTPVAKIPTPAQMALNRLLRIYAYSLGVGAATFAVGNLGMILNLLKGFHGLQGFMISTAAAAMGGPIVESTLKFFRAKLAQAQAEQDAATQ
jgi:hypothetical protein